MSKDKVLKTNINCEIHENKGVKKSEFHRRSKVLPRRSNAFLLIQSFGIYLQGTNSSTGIIFPFMEMRIDHVASPYTVVEKCVVVRKYHIQDSVNKDACDNPYSQLKSYKCLRPSEI
jgi:hypothetical protein